MLKSRAKWKKSGLQIDEHDSILIDEPFFLMNWILRQEPVPSSGSQVVLPSCLNVPNRVVCSSYRLFYFEDMDSLLEECGLDYSTSRRIETHVADIEDFFSTSDILTSREIGRIDVQNIKFYRLGGCRLILHLKHPASLYFKGSLGVKCLAGSVDVDGFLINSTDEKTYYVYSLPSHSASSFTSVEGEFKLTDGVIEQLKSLCVFDELETDVRKDTRLPSCLVLLWKHELPISVRPGIELATSLSASRRSYGGQSNFSEYEEFVNCVFDIPSGNRILNKVTIHQRLKDLAQELLTYEAPRLTICGGKGVGKSTSLRFIVNRLLCKWENVLCLDFDIGQPEFTVPGCVSVHLISKPLLGPSYTHLNTPLKSIFIGFVNADDCFLTYKNAIKEIKSYCSDFPQSNALPWVINTMGYVKGCGLLLNNDIISSFNLSHVVDLRSSNNPKVNFSFPPTYENVMRTVEDCPKLFYRLDTILSMTSNQKNAKICRELMVFFYLFGSTILRTQVIPLKKNSLSPGSSIVSCLPNPNALQRGEIVAVCSSESTASDLHSCLGFGKVESHSNDSLSLSTPLPESVFEDCLIVRGELSLRNEIFNKNVSNRICDAFGENLIVLTSGTKTLCPALFSK